jgi:hypothetical protein
MSAYGIPSIASLRTHCRALGALIFAASATIAGAGVAADAADTSKVIRIAFPIDVSGLDPAATQETYAVAIEARIFDALYVWDYLARPYRFVPSIAVGMPEISADGRVWTIRIRQGIYFADDPAFDGKKRELIAADFVYAWKRLLDPRVRSPNLELLDGKLVASAKRSRRQKRPDGSTTAKLQVRAPRSLHAATRTHQSRLHLLRFLGQRGFAAAAREVIEKHADASGRVMNNPVGTGLTVSRSGSQAVAWFSRQTLTFATSVSAAPRAATVRPSPSRIR